MVTADGKHTLVTHIFVNGCEYLKRDTVFGVKPSLIKDFEPQPAGTATQDGSELDRAWAKVRFDIVLAPARDEHDEDLHYVAVDEGQPRRAE